MANNDRLFSMTRKKRKIKDKKIQIYLYGNILDDYGTPMGKGLEIIHNGLWSYARQTSADEEYKSAFVSSSAYKVDMLFTINYRTGLDNDMVIRYQDKLYNIKKLDYFEGYKEDILISATYFGETTDSKLNTGLVDF